VTDNKTDLSINGGIMIKIKLCLLLIVVIALTGCKGEKPNPVPDSSIQSKEDYEIKEPALEDEVENSEQETNEQNDADENEIEPKEQDPVKDGFKRGKVYPSPMYDLSLDYIPDVNLYHKEAEKYKIVVDVFSNWYQMDVHDFIEDAGGELGDCGMNGFSLNKVTKDFVMDETIQNVISEKTPKLDWDRFFGFFDNPLIVTSGTTQKGFPYIQYALNQTKEGERVEYWHFVRVNDEIIIEFHTILDWDNRDEMDYILNSVFLTERDD